MSDATIVLITLVVYKLVLLAVGLWASRRNHSTSDYYIGGRALGPWVAAVSASASSSSAWTLLGVSGAAYLWGVSAIWLLPSVMLGFCFNWFWVAPRINKMGHQLNAITLTDLLISSNSAPLARTIRKAATLIVVFCFTFYIAAQFKAAGTSFHAIFNLDLNSSIIIGAVVILVYTLLGGFWAVSVTDTIQGLLMAGAAILLPIAALIEVGGVGDLISGLKQLPHPTFTQLTGEFVGISAIGFILGLFGIASGYPGQPHVVNRLMALKDEAAIKQGRFIALTWALLVYIGMLLLGWSARLLLPFLDNPETAFFEVTQNLFSPIFAGILIAAVLSAVMSTADSQILVVSSSISYDMNQRQSHSMVAARLAVLAVGIMATSLAILLDDSIFNRVLFAWNAIGSAFAPLLIIRLMGKEITDKATLGAMMAGFGLTVLINSYPNLPGDIGERWVPFLVAFTIAWLGIKKPS
ncbi:MAG: sodium/proline symporter [Gammaproteobacteria bacterium]|nr:sodium/proline symporter [Gammaproteobacteria bacterium]